ncbi:MAG: hypothetical protein OXI77_03345 [Chloroflexota bacterium]|nr:hypothetical protein [Chloroflexota bacterium]MDE2910399.1 hypothetical protein [Chloroflexota bacterium]
MRIVATERALYVVSFPFRSNNVSQQIAQLSLVSRVTVVIQCAMALEKMWEISHKIFLPMFGPLMSMMKQTLLFSILAAGLVKELMESHLEKPLEIILEKLLTRLRFAFEQFGQ